MRLCIFILRLLSRFEKFIEAWRPKTLEKKVEETFFLYDFDTQEIEEL